MEAQAVTHGCILNDRCVIASATAAYEKQVKSLEALGRALYLEVLELRKERDRALESRTLLGHAKNLMGYLLSAYCLYKCAAQSDAGTATVELHF